MALEDYYKKLNFVEYKRVPDGFGGWKGQWDIGAEFNGLITLASDIVQNTEALRGNLTKQYRLSVPTNTPLKKGDKVAENAVIATATENALSLPVHAPLAGTVKEVTDKFVVIEVD